jgi:subtilisin family serine protease
MVADQQSIDTVRDAGFAIISERPLTAFTETLARIRVRRGRSVEQTISELQALAPLASIAPDHLFRPSGDEVVATSAGTTSLPVAAINAGHVGVIDTGADVSWPALTHSIVQTEGFADGGYTSRAHGTLVSEIVARSGARLTVADVFGVDADNRLIAPAAAIASAIDWLVVNRVRVINISIEGPDNFVLAHVIKRALAADVAIVAAAGNGGPAAAPAFPAAYPGVIAVTAVDENGQVYRRANRGDYIAFAARGVHVESDYESATSKAKTVSGTSFASPVVAAAIARRLDGSGGISGVIESLKSEARDLGTPGRDAIYGWGELDVPQALTANSR